MVRFFTPLIAILLFSFSTLAQNYQPIYSNSLQVFYHESNGLYSNQDNMWGTRIDSVRTDFNGDTLLYNYLIVRDTALEADPEAYWENRWPWYRAPNWSGSEVHISNNGISYFFNSNNDTIIINHTANIGDSWLAYQYPNGDLLKAVISDIFYTNDIWLQDSVKSISFTRFDSLGNQVASLIENFSLEIYQHHGFRKALDFVKFPYDSLVLNRINLDYFNMDETILKRSQVDDIATFYEECEEMPSYYYQTNSSSLKSWVTVEVIPISGGDSLKIKQKLLRQYYSHSINTSTSPPTVNNYSSPIDSDIYIHTEPTNSFTPIAFQGIEQLMPKEKAFYLHYEPISESLCEIPLIFWSTCDDRIYQAQNESWFNGFFKCLWGTSYTFYPYFGVTKSSWNIDSGNNLQCNEEIVYAKREGFECGERKIVGIKPTDNNSINVGISPNPTQNQFTLSLPGMPDYSNTFMEIYDLTGRLVQTEKLYGETNLINTENLSKGAYLVKVYVGGESKTLKLALQD